MNLYQSSLYSKNEIWDWLPPDSLDLFEKNYNQHNNESLIYYKENPIKYRFNNYGFRSHDDFDDINEGNIFLGCSHTLGVGHHLENTWAYKLNKDIGGKFWNLSQGGSGIQTAFRLLYGFKDYLKIKNIFHLSIFHPRYEYLQEDRVIKLANWQIDDDIRFNNEETTLTYWDDGKEKTTQINSFKEFYVNILGNPIHLNFTNESYIYAIKGLSKEIGCNYYNISSLGEKDDTLEARDLIHSTTGQQNFIYEKFKKLWQE
tara:strand:+ start:3555 stop:4331 length:777 start_codon:yes stop_codon:yes gene_type:complete